MMIRVVVKPFGVLKAQTWFQLQLRLIYGFGIAYEPPLRLVMHCFELKYLLGHSRLDDIIVLLMDSL